jgi:CRP-like cAMP-binding protein
MKLFREIGEKAPQGGLNPNRGFVEPGAFRTKRFRRLPEIEMFEWNSISSRIRSETESAMPKRDRMSLTRYYQSLLDSNEVQTRAELARYMGVSRTHVTQALKRLDESNPKSA